MITHRVQDLPPQMGLKTMQRNSSSKHAAPSHSSELMSRNAEEKKKEQKKKTMAGKYDAIQGFCEIGEGSILTILTSIHLIGSFLFKKGS